MASSYAWVVTEWNTEVFDDMEKIDDSPLPFGTSVAGPRDATNGMIDALLDGAGTRFTMMDDDGIWYYKGRIIGGFEGYEPLADYGTPNGGAVFIHYPGNEWLDSEWG